jgi:hypothetical protein
LCLLTGGVNAFPLRSLPQIRLVRNLLEQIPADPAYLLKGGDFGP